MSTMTVMPSEGDWKVGDLDELPDDGLQYELVGGTLLVTPAPVPKHQRTCRGLFRLLDAVCPRDLEVFFAPLDYRPDMHASVQPDLVVVRRAEVGEAYLTVAPLLAVEVLSPATRRKDVSMKRALYEECGVASFWAVDPDEPSLRV